jgi:hypothetical protein
VTYAWNPTPAERSILAQIRQSQSGGRYNILFGGTYFSDYSQFPQWAGVIYQGRPTHAAGAYQDEPATWTEIAAATGLTDFTPPSQDIGNLWLLRTYGQFSQWATNFTDDGGHYTFPADASAAPSPPPLPPTPVTSVMLLGADEHGNTATVTIELSTATPAARQPAIPPFPSESKP